MSIAELEPKATPGLKPIPSLPSQSRQKQAINVLKPTVDLPDLCRDLRELQRQRTCNLKSRIMIENRLTATVATASGYHAGMEAKERTKRLKAAGDMIRSVRSEGVTETEKHVAPLILSTLSAIDGFNLQIAAYESEMEQLAKQLPVASWVAEPSQRGFGILTLAKIVGECGDLNNYPAPGKLWKRMGCAPFESRGQMKMPSTWRGSKPSLSAEEWEECGYNPRRRSLAYLISDGLIKQNADGPYRARYDQAKARAAEVHPEWTVCKTCKGTGKSSRGTKCSNKCDNGKVMMHCHMHAALLCSKLLLKNLWIEWTDGGNDCY